ncbi:hypothetical protein C672_3517 [[Clostridium] bifermentans ATCC 638]|uniref:Uncharacterized protein n=1 Tax=Paraclostridium bifermentans ATCC 638 = DSM 14991 TaxID=1233171 RepID=T4VGX3_PARBF|nr:hypothetical protein [Paraclostridium bifermentans]EQK40011.1 hypothetical protein C672_3517 [[Clostridium] bifermentans ATCC 638] [Paraclostridium bifermentans ATCC 638 = DSM 14991]RIZ57516.1 hypothetical protein CHH45_16105 [Paraclostridium bifermentans]UAG19985.1 hypothetical protein KXZ80_17045 [Paraclostridium bifermentans]
MYKVTKVDMFNEDKVIKEIELYPNETPIIIDDKLYIMNEEEHTKYKNGTLETYGTYLNTRKEDYIVKYTPYHLEANEKFVIEELGSNI